MKKTLVYILSVFIIGVFNLTYISSQSLNKKDPTYFTSNNRTLTELIRWNGDSFEQIAFCTDSTLRADGYPLNIKTSQYPTLNNTPFAPFVLDTNYYNQSGYCYFYPHPSWFKHLVSVNILAKNNKTVFGQLTNPNTYKKNKIKDLFKMLIQFNVVDTYDHLYAELVITKEKEDAEKIQIHYHCMYHLCTSTCVDPEYNFSLIYLKKTGELIAEGK